MDCHSTQMQKINMTTGRTKSKRNMNVDEIREKVQQFISKYRTEIDIKKVKVSEKREMVILLRRVLEGFPGHLKWKNKPSYWSTDVCFWDPNNEMKDSDSVNEMLLFLVQLWHEKHQTEHVGSSSWNQESGSIDDHQAPSDGDWKEVDQYRRIKAHLRTLPIDAPLLQKLLQIVEHWITDSGTYVAEAHELERIVDKIQLEKKEKKQIQLDLIQRFVDRCPIASTSVDNSVEGCGDIFHLDEVPDEEKKVMKPTGFRAEVPSIQETVPENDTPFELVRLCEDRELESVSDLKKISNRWVEDQTWLNESSFEYCGSRLEAFQMNSEEDWFTFLPDKQHCEFKCQLFRDVIQSEDGKESHYDLQPILTFLKNLTGINLEDLDILRYLGKMGEIYPNVYICNFCHQLGSKLTLSWPEEKSKILLPCIDVDDSHFFLFVADQDKRIVYVLDAVQNESNTEKLEQLKQSLMHLAITNGKNGNASHWKSVDVECPKLKKDSVLSDECVSAYFALMNAEAVVNGIKPTYLHQNLIPEFKVWLEFMLQCDKSCVGLFNVLSRLKENCSVCSGVNSFPHFTKLLKEHDVT